MAALPPDWYQAIFLRHSRRSFMPRRPEEEKVAGLEDLCRSFRPFPGAKAEFVRSSPEEVFKGFIGSYGKISGAPYYMAFIGLKGGAGEGVGYTGEGLVLAATTLGLGTCWVSGFFRPEAVTAGLVLEKDERVYAVTPVGYAERDYSVKDRIYRTLAGSRKRKPLSQICEGTAADAWQEQALEAARLAPSAANRQPWLFGLEPGSITVRTAGSKDSRRYPKRLDCGIAMLHLELGALAAGVPGRWVPLAPPGVARFEAQK